MGAPGGKPAALAGLGAALLLAAVSAASAAGPARLKHELGALASQRRSAALDLYALDARIAATTARASALQREADALHVAQLRLRQRVAATAHTLAASRRQLAFNLRRLYKQGDVNALAVLLGAVSLDQALSRLDSLNAVTDESEQVISAATAAQRRLVALRASLAARTARLDLALVDARRTLADLAAAHARRVAFVAHLRNAERMKAAQIDALQARVRHAQKKAAALQAAATPPSAPAPTADGPQALAAAPAPSGGRTLTVTSTGYSLPGHTATGLPVGWGVVAVDPVLIPLGTRLTIPGYGEGVAADVGSSVHGRDVDLWFPTLAQARAWGRRTITITLH